MDSNDDKFSWPIFMNSGVSHILWDPINEIAHL